MSKSPIDPRDPTPLYLQVERDLRSKLRARAWGLGKRIGSQQELAEEYGVSLITIRKALSGLTDEGVIYSRVGQGAFVGRIPGSEEDVKHRTVGVVLRDFSNPFFSLIIHGVEGAATECQCTVLISQSSGRSQKEDTLVRHLRSLGVDGLIIASTAHVYRVTPPLQEMIRNRFPFVMVSYVKEDTVPYVGTDNEKGGFIATKHLIDLGYKRIGFINGERGNLVGELRCKGYRRALLTHGRQPEERFQFRLRLKGGVNDQRSGYEIGLKIASMRQKPDAMFIYNDLSALGFQEAILERGLRIPEDIAIVGFDNIERGEHARVPLTTVEQPTAAIGREAFAKLIVMIEGDHPPMRTILEPRILQRASCGASIRSPQIRKAT